MTAFLASIAFLLAVALLAAGLLTLHRSRSENSPGLVTTAAIVLLLGGLCGIFCSSYYFLKYYFAGELESAAPVPAQMMRGTMGGSMMQGDRSHRGQRMMQMMMQDPEMMQMMHRMMHEQGMPMMEGDMPMEDDMPMRDRERLHQPDDDPETGQ
jgi:heme A synthase